MLSASPASSCRGFHIDADTTIGSIIVTGFVTCFLIYHAAVLVVSLAVSNCASHSVFLYWNAHIYATDVSITGTNLGVQLFQSSKFFAATTSISNAANGVNCDSFASVFNSDTMLWGPAVTTKFNCPLHN